MSVLPLFITDNIDKNKCGYNINSLNADWGDKLQNVDEVINF